MFKINKIFVYNSNFMYGGKCHILTECNTEYGNFVLLNIVLKDKNPERYQNIYFVPKTNFEILTDEISKGDNRLVNVELKHADFVFFEESYQREPYDNIEEKTKKYIYEYIDNVLRGITEEEEPTEEDIEIMSIEFYL